VRGGEEMSASPRDVLQRLLDQVSSDEWTRLHELYAEDIEVRHPLADDESRHLKGRDALRTHFAHLADSRWRLRARDVVMHIGEDPEIVVGQFIYDVVKPGDAREYEMAACFVWRVRDGLVVDASDYLDAPKLARSTTS
jgi:ketosteroid isomerase-like protein